MQKVIFKGIVGGLLMLGFILTFSLAAFAIDKEVAENPLMYPGGYAKPATVAEVICMVGFVQNRIHNNTVHKATGTNERTILIGDSDNDLPSMIWLSPTLYSGSNHYLYYASLRIGQGTKLVHFSTETSPGIDTTSINYDPEAISNYDTYFTISDSLAGPDDYIGIKVHSRTYAWSEAYRDDFIIYDFQLLNLNADPLTDIYVAWHSDADISAASGGSGTQGFWRDDLPGYYRDDVAKEYISYMYDADNTTIAGEDTGGRFLPKESTGYIGTRLLYCPPITGSSEPSVQIGHGWWDWNSDPADDPDWMTMMTSGAWLDPPSSPHDFRYLQSMGPFEIPANDSIRVVFAFGIGEGLQGLRDNLEWALRLLNAGWIGPSAPAAPTFTLTPGDRQVELEWNDFAETSPDPATGVVDFEGYRVWRRVGDVGTWTLLMECDLINEMGHNTGLVHSYLDTDVNNGYQYSFVVTAYDRGEPENNIDSFESGKGGFQMVEIGLDSGTRNEASSGIHVVPNPFVKLSPKGFGFVPDQLDPSHERILFVNLPLEEEATVTIYSLSGDRLMELQKGSGTRTVDWNLITRKDQKIVAGVYLYVVESDGLDENHIDKFMVVR